MPPKEIKITGKVLDKAESLASTGLIYEQIAPMLGMGTSTLYKKLKDNVELQEAIKRGKAKAVGEITNALYDTAMNGNTTAQIFFLKNRAGWADKTEVEMNATHEVNYYAPKKDKSK